MVRLSAYPICENYPAVFRTQINADDTDDADR